ncbi:MAG: T9SS type A sorting domain-containing protein [Bacteroidales bacterium]|nr:T9SS type A sorting domain-containing protein [Bacteroidales bacterium]MCF8454679.1 T9SS type A sorting domain-containing protein [Bacteroidales bacterium]
MKKYLLLVSCIVISCVSFSQNYLLINPDKVAHFLNNQSDIYSIRIDSASVSGVGSTLYNHKVLTHTSSGSCLLLLTDSSWIGDRIIAKGNGDYLFFNKLNDSILVKTFSKVNDYWTCFRLNNGDYLEATLAAINPEPVNGSLDSVKRVSLQAKNSGNMNISHPLNGKEIMFSKSNGLVQFFNMQNFPDDTSTYSLIGFHDPNADSTNVSASDIFNYDVGDEFHYEDYSQSVFSPWMYTYINRIKIILSKMVSVNQDTLTYLVERCETKINNSTSTNNPDTTSIQDTITEQIILSNYTMLNTLSFEPIDTNLNTFNSGYSQFSINQTHNRKQKTLYNFYNQTSHGCWEGILSDPPASPLTYIDGLGGGYYDLGPMNNHFQLVYYKKGSLTWGSPLICNPSSIGIANLQENEIRVEIFPNPFSESTTITINNFDQKDNLSLKLFVITGKEILSFPVSQKTFTLMKNSLPSGMYFYHIVNDRQEINYSGKIVIQ